MRDAVPLGSAARSSGGLVAASGRSEALERQRASCSVVDRTAWFGGLEHFDDDHAPALTGGALRQGSTGELLVLIAI